MRAGQFSEIVVFQELAREPNGGGGFSANPVDRFTRRARVRARSQSVNDQGVAGGAQVNLADYECTVRVDDQTDMIQTNWRIKWAGGVFKIVSLLRSDRRARTRTMIIQEIGQS